MSKSKNPRKDVHIWRPMSPDRHELFLQMNEGPDADYDWERSELVPQRLKQKIRAGISDGKQLLFYWFECPRCRNFAWYYSIRRAVPCYPCRHNGHEVITHIGEIQWANESSELARIEHG